MHRLLLPLLLNMREYKYHCSLKCNPKLFPEHMYEPKMKVLYECGSKELCHNGERISRWGEYHIIYLGSDLTRVGGGDATSFDGVEYEDEFSFLYVVPAEPPSIVGHYQALFKQPTTHYARQTACRVMGSDPATMAKESYIAHGSLRYHPFRVPQENISRAPSLWETKTGARRAVMIAVSSLCGGKQRRWGGNTIQEEGDRVA
jgi:hypothetical protein